MVGVAVDREVVAELHQVGEAERRRAIAESGLRLGEAGELGIGGREQHDIPRRLAEVDGVGAVLDGAGLRREQVQVGLLASDRRFDGRAVERGEADHDEAAFARFVRAPVAVEVAIHARADRLHHEPPALAATSRKPLARSRP